MQPKFFRVNKVNVLLRAEGTMFTKSQFSLQFMPI